MSEPVPIAALGDSSVFYDEAGAGDPAIVLVHGGMCDHRDWDRLLPLLARDHRVIRIVLRGHGQSTGDATGHNVAGWASDVVAIVETLELDRPVLVGHSLGARIVAEAASRALGRVAGVVLLDGSRAHGGYAAPALSKPQAQASLDAIIDATIGPFADDEARRSVHSRMSSASPEIMSACVAAMRDWDLERADEAFAAIGAAMPALAIQSTYHDPATPRHSFENDDATSPYLDFLRESIPALEVKIVTHAGHFLMLERPDMMAATISDFAARAVAG